jgi:hypothetical protein
MIGASQHLLAQTVITVSVPSGSYSRDQRIGLEAGSDVDLYYSFAESRDSRFVPYLFPFTLSALTDEQRFYTLRVEARVGEATVKKKEFSYLIDKKPPSAPKISIPAGTFGSSLSLSFTDTLGSGTANGERILYCVNGNIQEDAREWTGEEILLSSAESTVVGSTVTAYSVDAAGNMSDLGVWTYTIDTSTEIPIDGLQILSPVPGAFANRQHLVIRSAGYEWIRYTFGGENPRDFGSDYSSALLIDLEGQIKLRVAGKLVATGEIRTAEVDFSVESARLDLYGIEGGVYDEAVPISVESREPVFFSLDDTPASRKALVYTEPFRIDLVENGLKYIALRVVPESAVRERRAEFRYFFTLDDRTPSQPVIRLSERTPLREDAVVSILGPADAAIHYTMDGTSPDMSSPEYSGPFELHLPEDSQAGSIFVKAASFGANRRSSRSASALITFDRVPPTPPEITYLGKNKSAGIIVGVKGEFGSAIVFEMTLDDSLPGVPDSESFRSDGFIDLDVPYGMERIFAFRFASVDNAGNLSSPTAPFRVLVDKVPPGPPEISWDGEHLTLQGGDSLYYTLTNDGSEPKLPDLSAQEYIAPVVLQFDDNGLNEMKVKAVAIDKSGNTSRVSNTYQIVVDRREPVLPDFVGVVDGGIFNDSRTLAFIGEGIPGTIYYTMTTDGSEPADPGIGDSAVAGDLGFAGVPGASVQYRLKFRPFLENNSVSGDIQRISFFIDREHPENPLPMGFNDEATYNHGVFVLPPPGFDGDVYIDIDPTGQNDADPLGQDARRFFSPLRLDVENGAEGTFSFALAARDPAGNTTENPVQYRVTIDRKPPPPPVLTGVPPGGSARDGVELVAESDFPTYYEMTTDGTLPSVPTQDSEKYAGAMSVAGEQGREILYTMRFLSFDEAENSSQQSIARFVIDRLPPPPPGTPRVDYAADPSITISWAAVGEDKIYYSLADDGEGSSADFVEYGGPFALGDHEATESLQMRYFARDKAGNQSDSGALLLELPGRSGGHLFSGVEDGLIYNSRKNLTSSPEGGDIRYEVTTNGPIPAYVSPFSTAMPESLSFDAAPGETLKYAIRAAVFKEGDSSPIQEQIVRFIIDRTPPAPPEIADWQDEMFFQDDFQVTIQEAEGDVYVSVNDGSYRLYTAPISLRSVSGEIDQYRISAYTKDEAGNRSTVTREWTAYIDRQVIYVSPRGNDLFDGSRSRPFRTISLAVLEAEKSERKTIYLAEGTYRVAAPITVRGKLTLVGGFTENTWKETSSDSASELIVAPEFPEGAVVLSIGDSSTAAFRNFTVRTSSGFTRNTYLFQRGGSLQVTNCSFLGEAAGPAPLIQHVHGESELLNTTVYSRSFSGPTIVDVFGGEFSMSGSTVEYEDAEADVTLIRAEGVKRFEITDSFLEPGTGRRTVGLQAEHSSVILRNTRINTGAGRTKATAVAIAEGNLDARGAILVGNRSAWIATCLDASFSDVTVVGSTIDALADRGAVAIQTEGVELDLQSTRVRGLQGSEFIYLMNLSNTRGLVTGNMLSGERTRDFIGFFVQGSTVTLLNNTLVARGGSNVTTGISLEQSPGTRVINNILYGNTGVAIRSDGPADDLRILNNAFDAWHVLLESRDLSAALLVDLERADLEVLGGGISGNLVEEQSTTFATQTDGVYRLSPDSFCVNSGFNPLLLYIRVGEDYEGDLRREPYDIGADEL